MAYLAILSILVFSWKMSIFSWFFTLGVLNSWVDGWGLLIRTKSQMEIFLGSFPEKVKRLGFGLTYPHTFLDVIVIFLGFVNNVSCHIFCTSHHWVPLLHRHHIRLIVSCLLSFGGVVVTFHLESGAKSNQVVSVNNGNVWMNYDTNLGTNHCYIHHFYQ